MLTAAKRAARAGLFGSYVVLQKKVRGENRVGAAWHALSLPRARARSLSTPTALLKLPFLRDAPYDLKTLHHAALRVARIRIAPVWRQVRQAVQSGFRQCGGPPRFPAQVGEWGRQQWENGRKAGLRQLPIAFIQVW